MESKLEELINQIKELKEEVKELNKEVIVEKEELEDKDVIEITSTTQFVDGKPISTTMKYKYKEAINQDIECERNIYGCGINGGDKDYQATSYYDNRGDLIKENIECLNHKQ